MKRSIVVCIVIAFAGVGLVSRVVSSLAQADRNVVTPPRTLSILSPQDFITSSLIANLIGQVQPASLYNIVGDLSGEWPVIIGGVPYTLTTRYTASGVPISMATQYVYEHFQSMGLAASYQPWTGTQGITTYMGVNVIGVLTGTSRPDEIVLISGHVDSLPDVGLAPGADDDASAIACVLTAADIFRHYHFQRTIRFVAFTGEEQGKLGSQVYAAQARAAGDNIVAVYSMELIAYNSSSGPASFPRLELNTRPLNDPQSQGDLVIANTFVNVVNGYGLSDVLAPLVITAGVTRSDHASFWAEDYPAILANEDWLDRNPNYHSSNDQLQYLNMAYFTNFTKASVGTVAHLAYLEVYQSYLPLVLKE